MDNLGGRHDAGSAEEVQKIQVRLAELDTGSFGEALQARVEQHFLDVEQLAVSAGLALPPAPSAATPAAPATRVAELEAEAAGVEVAGCSAEGEDASIAEPPVQGHDWFPDDLIAQVVKSTDTSALCDVKAVSKAWCSRARQELHTRVCSYVGEDIDGAWNALDVQGLRRAGLAHQVVAAGRELRNLAWLHGYGFWVDVPAVRLALVSGPFRQCSATGLSSWDEDASLDSLSTLWRGPGAAALRACFSTPTTALLGRPPRKLLLATLAFAGSGTLLGIPVRHLRHLRDVDESEADYNDAFDFEGDHAELDLSDRTMNADGVKLLALLLPGSKVKHLIMADGTTADDPCDMKMCISSMLSLLMISACSSDCRLVLPAAQPLPRAVGEGDDEGWLGRGVDLGQRRLGCHQ